MTKTITAKYNQGVFEPTESLDLQEGEMFRVIISQERKKEKQETVDTKPNAGKKHLLENLSQLRFESDITDGAVNHDKYIYDDSPCLS